MHAAFNTRVTLKSAAEESREYKHSKRQSTVYLRQGTGQEVVNQEDTHKSGVKLRRSNRERRTETTRPHAEDKQDRKRPLHSGQPYQRKHCLLTFELVVKKRVRGKQKLQQL